MMLRAFSSRMLPADTPLYTALRAAYPGFDAWLATIRTQDRPCFALYTTPQTLTGLAILADKGPDRVKLCTFLTQTPGTGAFFLDKVVAAARDRGAVSLYGDAHAHANHVLSFFSKQGFVLRPHPTKPDTMLMTRTL